MVLPILSIASSRVAGSDSVGARTRVSGFQRIDGAGLDNRHQIGGICSRKEAGEEAGGDLRGNYIVRDACP